MAKSARGTSRKKVSRAPLPWWRRPFHAIARRVRAFLSRRPHRSFRLTRRRDYRRSLKLPGYVAFTHGVNKTLWKNRKLFLWFIVAYTIISMLLISVMSQASYGNLRDSVGDATTGIAEGNWGAVGNATLVLLAVFSSATTGAPDAGQQVYTILLILMIWLTTVWLLRNILAGHKVRLRDGIYNAGAPVISTFVVLAVFIIQLLPLALAIITGVVASQTGVFANGPAAMIVGGIVGLLGILSFYWATASFMALVVVTLPGMYPFRALSIAGDMVVGRRLRILMRIMWGLIVIVVTWFIVMVPVILFDTWIKERIPAIEWVPFIPILLVGMSVLTITWFATYVYLLYRKVVDDDALPA